jgi:replicative DNA helicase
MSGSADGKGTNREQEISKISRDLKGMAKELGVPIIALSQLSRDVEKRKDGNKMPQLSDLRESGAIEQDADMVLFLYRPEYYEINTNEMGESNKGETHVRIAKHRNGQLDTIKLRAVLEFQRFEDDGLVDGPGPASGGGGNTYAGFPSPNDGANNEAKFFIQKGSKMNDMEFEEDAPF